MSSNIKPLVINQEILTWLCVLPAGENTQKWKKLVRIALIVTLIVSDLTASVSSLMYFLKFMSADFEGASSALFIFIALIPMTNTIVMGYLLRDEVTSIFANLTELYAKCMDEFQ